MNWAVFRAQFWTVLFIVGPVTGIKTAAVGESIPEYVFYFFFGVAFVTPIAAIAGLIALAIHHHRMRRLARFPVQVK
jgi:hypothetical protein